MRIMFFNVWAGLLPKVTKYIQSAAADIDLFCLSEVHNLHLPKNKHSDSKRYLPTQGKKGGEHELNLFRLLQEAVCDSHIGYYSPNLSGIHDLEESDMQVEYGLATFVRRNLSPFTYRTGSLHRPLGQFNEGSPASRSVVSLMLPYQGSHVLVGHMHGLWDERGKVDTPERFAQNARALEFLRQHRDFEARDARLPVLFGGDFNLTSKTAALRNLVKSKVFGPDGGENLNEKFAITDTLSLIHI